MLQRVVDPNRPVNEITRDCLLTEAANVSLVFHRTENFREEMAGKRQAYVPRYERGIKNLGIHMAGEIRSVLATEHRPDADLRITVRMTHIHPLKDELRTRLGGAKTCLSCLTFLIYPDSGETEEKVVVRVRKGNRLIREHTYLFHRLNYFGWLLIPVNLLITPFVDSYAITHYMEDIKFNRIMTGMTARLRRDMKKLKCDLARADNQPVAFRSTEPAVLPSRRPSGE